MYYQNIQEFFKENFHLKKILKMLYLLWILLKYKFWLIEEIKIFQFLKKYKTNNNPPKQIMSANIIEIKIYQYKPCKQNNKTVNY